MENFDLESFALGFAALGLIVIVAFALFIVRSGDFNGKR